MKRILFIAAFLLSVLPYCRAQDAGPDQTICANIPAVMAATGIGSWSELPSNPALVTIDDPNSETTLMYFGYGGVYGLVWNTLFDADTVYITVNDVNESYVFYRSTYNFLCGPVVLPDTFRSQVYNIGPSATYQWYKNGIPVSTAPIYIDNSLVNGDSIWVHMVSGLTCPEPLICSSQHEAISINTSNTPLLSASGGACLGQDSLTLHTMDSAYAMHWFNTGTQVANFTTGPAVVAGGDRFSYNNPMIGARDVFVDRSGNIYICDNNSVKKFPPNSNMFSPGVIVAGGNGTGSAANQLWFPTSIFVDSAGYLYVGDSENERVQKFPPGSTSATNGITIIGGNGVITGPISGLYVDGSGFVYVGDYRDVKKFPPGSSSGTAGVTIAGGGTGNYQNFQTLDITFDKSGNLYVCQLGTVVKFPPNCTPATDGIVVAGGAPDLGRLGYPTAISIDTAGYLYVVGRNAGRVYSFPPGSDSSTPTTLAAGRYGLGEGFDQFSFPTAIALDVSGNMYVLDNSYRVMKWGQQRHSQSYLPAAAGVYTATYTSATGCNSLQSNAITVSTCIPAPVWPGDADANHLVDNTDLLPIGLGYDSTGPARSSVSIVWQTESAPLWPYYFTSYPAAVNFNNADCDGSGLINATDTMAILQNFSLTHTKTNGSLPWRTSIPGLRAVMSADSLYAGDTLTVTFILGDSTTPANNIYGLAFTYNFDPLVVDSAKTSMTIGSSWLGNSTDKIAISKTLNAAGQIKAAVTRIDHINRSGNGPIGVASFKITTDNISGKDLAYYANIGFISDVTAIDEHGNRIQLNEGADTTQVGYTPTSIRDILSETITLRPNPAQDQVTISADHTITGISLVNVAGQQVYYRAGDGRRTQTIDVSALDQGIYFIHIQTTGSKGVAKLSLMR